MLALLLAAMMSVSVLAGCNQNEQSETHYNKKAIPTSSIQGMAFLRLYRKVDNQSCAPVEII